MNIDPDHAMLVLAYIALGLIAVAGASYVRSVARRRA